MLVPDDELCIQMMLGIDQIPADIQHEYMIRARMLHRQLAGGAIGAVAIVDMLRSLGYGPPPAGKTGDDGRIDWRKIEIDTPVNVCTNGTWTLNSENITFQGCVGQGTLAVRCLGQINEYNAFDVRLADIGLPNDVDEDSFTKPGRHESPKPDARIDLIPDDAVSQDDADNGFESEIEQSEIGDEGPPNVTQKVHWQKVRKGTPVWFRDGDDMKDAKFLRCHKTGMAKILVEGENEPREVDRNFLKLP